MADAPRDNPVTPEAMARDHALDIVQARNAAPGAPATIPIAETFLSIQGEGRLSGVPSFFIRVSGCNLRCAWCDTPYASWSPEGKSVALQALVQQAVHSGARHVVLTGGEPMVFSHVEPLSLMLREAGLHITIETAGTIHRRVACDLMSISPKLASSTPGRTDTPDPRDPGGAWRQRHEARRLNVDVLQHLINEHPERQFKFVITEARERDLAEIESLLARLSGWNPGDVMLMPEGVSPPSSEFRHWIVGECIRRGWRYCPRVHIEVFGNRRGT